MNIYINFKKEDQDLSHPYIGSSLNWLKVQALALAR